jgi:NADPH:quinone reductase-like Zn-dependent oxidoreductase/acyl dehydratase
MNAVICKSFGLPDSLGFGELPNPVVREDEVLIKVHACGVNFPDLLIIQNKYQFKPELPFSPGGEVSGIIESVGAKIKHFKAGDRVVALCGWGGFAEKVVAKANRVFPMPIGMDFINGACTLYTYGTSYHALKDRAQLKPCETLLVLGAAGGVGMAAVELGKVMGATVIAAASSDEKLKACEEKGATHLINYSTQDLRGRIKEITGEKGVDVVYDAIGGKLAEQALRSIAWKGRYLVVGFTTGEIPNFPANLPLLKGCSIMGVFWGSFAEREPQQSFQNVGALLGMMKTGAIKQHIHKIYSLEDAPKSLDDLMNRKVVGKAVVKIGDWKEERVVINPLKSETKIAAVDVTKPIRIQLADIKKYIGQSLGVTDWFTVTQETINEFAHATQDNQWIHVDIDRAKQQMPEGKTIAHGYLTMSLAAKFFYELIEIEGATTAINYGLNKARFPMAVKSGSRIRMTGKIVNIEDMPNHGIKLFVEAKIEIEGEEKPAYIGELLTALY